MGAALGESENRLLRNFFHKADTAAAHDAAFVVEADVFANVDVFGFLDLGFLEAGLATSVLNRKFLKLALTSLVANRAIQRVVD